MLQVRVHTDNGVAAAVIQPSDHGRLVAEIPGKADYFHPAVPLRQAVQNGQAAVRAAVVDKHQLIIPVQLI